MICDIDGCLGPESAAPLDAARLLRVAEHNRRAIEVGDRPVVTLCSGRPQPFAEAMCRFLANSSLPCVAENGVWIFDPRDNRFLMDPSITGEHLGFVREATRWIEGELVPRGVVIQPGKSASISLWHPDTGLLKREVMPTVRARFEREGWRLRVSATVAWINCDLEHVSKGTGIDRLVGMTGLARGRLAGIGDSPSDLAIRERVAYFGCPSNAAAELAARSDYVSPLPEVGGVLDILERVST